MSPVTHQGCVRHTEDEKIGVVVSILPQSQFVESIGKDRVRVTVMVPAGANPHIYEPTPGQLIEVSKAKMYAKVGSSIEFELAWLDKIVSANEKMLVVDCSQGIEQAGADRPEETKQAGAADRPEETKQAGAADRPEGTEQEGAEDRPKGMKPAGMDASDNLEAEGHRHLNEAVDPHIWVSPRNAIVMVENIYEGLASIDPQNREYYKSNMDSYVAILEELDDTISRALSGKIERKFIVYHPSWGYLARHYNLQQLPVEEEGKAPTARGIRRLIEQARRHEINIVFASPQFSAESAEVIAKEIGGRVILVDPLEKDYVNNMKNVAKALAEAMK